MNKERSNANEIVRVENLYKSFGELEVLRNIKMSVNLGEVVAVVGPSGSGKSTLLRCLNYLEIPTGGNVIFKNEFLGKIVKNGIVVDRPEHELDRQRSRIGMVFQRFQLFPHLTAIQNIIEAPIHVRGIERSKAMSRGKELLARVGMAEKADEYPNRLSGGQQQRVAIARALAMDPELMLFDEATSALDPELVGEVLNVIQALAKDGMTMVIVTHEMSFAQDVADRILFMDRGEILEVSTPEEFFGRPAHPRAIEFLRTFSKH